MSGKRHHFIPRFLQDGFVSNGEGKRRQTWVYWQDRPPREVNLRHIGVEVEFYSKEGESTLDDAITDAEGSRYSPLIAKLVASPQGPFADDGVPELIAHLEARTRNMREGLLSATNYLVDQLTALVNDRPRFTEVLVEHYVHDPSSLIDVLQQQGLSRCEVLTVIRKGGRRFLRTVIGPTVPETAVAVNKLLSSDVLKRSIKLAHVEGMLKNLAPTHKQDRYSKLNSFIVEAPKGELVLGDSAVIFHTGHGKFRPFLDKDDVCEAAVLPLTPYKALVLARNAMNLQLKDVRVASVACSREYFIGHEFAPETEQLATQIGASAALLSAAELNECFRSVVGRGAEARRLL